MAENVTVRPCPLGSAGCCREDRGELVLGCAHERVAVLARQLPAAESAVEDGRDVGLVLPGRLHRCSGLCQRRPGCNDQSPGRWDLPRSKRGGRSAPGPRSLSAGASDIDRTRGRVVHRDVHRRRRPALPSTLMTSAAISAVPKLRTSSREVSASVILRSTALTNQWVMSERESRSPGWRCRARNRAACRARN